MVGREDRGPKFVANFPAPLSLSLCLHEMGTAPPRLLQGLQVFCDLQRATQTAVITGLMLFSSRKHDAMLSRAGILAVRVLEDRASEIKWGLFL